MSKKIYSGETRRVFPLLDELIKIFPTLISNAFPIIFIRDSSGCQGSSLRHIDAARSSNWGRLLLAKVFTPLLVPATIPHLCVVWSPHLEFANTCRYDGKRVAFRQSDVYTVVAGSLEIFVACSESCCSPDCSESRLFVYTSFLHTSTVYLFVHCPRDCSSGRVIPRVVVLFSYRRVSQKNTNIISSCVRFGHEIAKGVFDSEKISPLSWW